MSKNRITLLLISLIGILFVLFIKIKYDYNENFNYYKINSEYYLEKVDHFSKYNLLKRQKDQYVMTFSDIIKISVSDENIAVINNCQDHNEYHLIQLNNNRTHDFRNIDELSVAIGNDNLVWFSPMNITEEKTLSDNNKLLIQIILILIVILIISVLMRIFNIKKLFT